MSERLLCGVREVELGKWSQPACHSLEVEIYVLFGGLPGNLSPGGRLSYLSEGLVQRGKGGARIYRSFAVKDR